MSGHEWVPVPDWIEKWRCILCGTYVSGSNLPPSDMLVSRMGSAVRVTCEEKNAWKIHSL